MTDQFLKGFRDFLFNANLVSSACGIVLGISFGQLITSLVNDIIMPPLAVMLGAVNFNSLRIVLRGTVINASGEHIKEAITFNYGNFIQSMLNFLIIALSVFVLIKIVKRLNPDMSTDIKINPQIKG